MINIKVIKRDGRAVEYNSEKIKIAIEKANNDVLEGQRANEKQISNIIKYIESLNKKRMLVEDIQDIIETKLMEYKKYDLAKAYIIYRYTRALVRKSNTTDETILSIIKNGNKELNYEQYNPNKALASTQRDLIAKEVSKDLTYRILLPEGIKEAHNKGILYFHDSEYFIQPIINCSLINLSDMLDNQTVINGKMIETPKSFNTACNLLTQIIAVVASSEYGAQTVDISILGKYLNISKQKTKLELETKYKNKIKQEYIDKIVEEKIKQELIQGVQTIKYQINTLMTTSGKSPYVSIFLNLDKESLYNEENALIYEEIFKQKIKGIKNEQGKYEDIEFPKIIYCLNESNNLQGGKYDYLTILALECLKLRKSPSFVSHKVMQENYGSLVPPIYPNHFLISNKDEKGKNKSNGRFNQGLVTINLVDIAIKSNKDEEKFMNILDEVLDLAKEALLCKHYALVGTTSDVSPIHFRHGAISRLESKEKIDKLLKSASSTISLGYIGLKEVVKYLKNNTLEQEKDLSIKIIKKINQTLKKWQQETGLGFTLYSSYDDKTCKYFLEKDKEKYGIIKNITDKEKYTNSYFLEKEESSYQDIIDKLNYEKQFQKLSKGGTISKIDISSIEKDEEKIKDLVKFIYENIAYSEFIKK